MNQIGLFNTFSSAFLDIC